MGSMIAEIAEILNINSTCANSNAKSCVADVLNELRNFESALQKSKLHIVTMSFCAKLPKEAISAEFIAAIHNSPVFKNVHKSYSRVMKQSDSKGVKKVRKNVTQSMAQSSRKQKCTDTRADIEFVKDIATDIGTEKCVTKKVKEVNLFGAFVVTHNNNSATVKFYRNGNIQICGCKSANWVNDFVHFLGTITTKELVSLNRINTILIGKIRMSDDDVLNCAEISKFLNRTTNKWELSDFHGQSCTRSLQLFYNNGKRTYAGVHTNGSVRIITSDAELAVEMFDSIQYAVDELTITE